MQTLISYMSVKCKLFIFIHSTVATQRYLFGAFFFFLLWKLCDQVAFIQTFPIFFKLLPFRCGSVKSINVSTEKEFGRHF